MRPSRRHPLSAAHERPPPPRLQRGEHALSDRPCGRRGIASMEERARRDTLLFAMLPDVPFDGWSRRAIMAAGKRVGIDAAEAASLFPGGAREAVAAFSRWADRAMLATLAEQ